MALLQIGNRTFRDIESYNCAKRDDFKIENLKSEYDLTKVESINELIKNIENGKYRFESLLGDDFLEELDQLKTQLLEEGNTKKLRKDNAVKNKPDIKTKDKSDLNNKKQQEKVKTKDDELLELEIRKRVRRLELRRKIVVFLLSAVAFGCIAYLVIYYAMYFKNGAEYNELSRLVNEESTNDKAFSINLVKEDDSLPPILKKYETLYQKNRKLVGWLKIEGTNIDYPVMQTVNNEYYLEHNYNQEYDKNGSIFMDKDCDPAHPNDNMIIYGHHMKSGKMFGNLNLYSREDYYKEHPTIQFDTIYEEGTYAIMYVFRSKIYSEEEIVFKYYKFIDATSANEFESNMQEMADISLYDTGVTAKYGDRLITLSTCDSSETNGRFVVVAKKVK